MALFVMPGRCLATRGCKDSQRKRARRVHSRSNAPFHQAMHPFTKQCTLSRRNTPNLPIKIFPTCGRCIAAQGEIAILPNRRGRKCTLTGDEINNFQNQSVNSGNACKNNVSTRVMLMLTETKRWPMFGVIVAKDQSSILLLVLVSIAEMLDGVLADQKFANYRVRWRQ